MDRKTPRLPIWIGLQGGLTDGASDADALRSCLRDELRAIQDRYPHSPLVLLSESADDALRALAATLALPDVCVEELGPASGDSPPAPEPLAARCHILITVGRTAATAPAACLAAMGSDAVLEIEPRFYLRAIELGLDADAQRSRVAVARHWLAGPGLHAAPAAADADRALRRTDVFNRDTASLRPGSKPLGSRGSQDLYPRIQALFARADAAATDLQNDLHRAFKTIAGLAGAAALFYGLFQTLTGGNTHRQEWLLVPYVLLLVAAYAVFRSARGRDFHERFVEYRALAEALRVQFYWSASGVTGTSVARLLAARAVEWQWIRLAMRSVDPARGPFGPTGPAIASSAADRSEVLQHWIQDQSTYLARTVRHGQRAAGRAKWLTLGFFVLGSVATLLILLQSRLPAILPYLRYVSFVSFLGPTVVATLAALLNKLGVQYEAVHQARMQALYRSAGRWIAMDPLPPTEALARSLGQAALRETSEWTQFRRERRIEAPASPFRRPA